MAIYHLSVKSISRSVGRSATAAAAYRSACALVDQRTGREHDYTRKSGVLSSDIVLPAGSPAWATDRSKLWNAAELAEKRKDACVAREYEVALPSELTPAQRRGLVLAFAKRMADAEGCAVDASIHAPGRGGDDRNHHAHIMRTTRRVEADGLGAKLDTEKADRKRKEDLAKVRQLWETLTNDALEQAGKKQRIDHRTLAAQGIDREPTKHLGPAATEYERRTEEASDKRLTSQHQQASDHAAMAAIDARIQALGAERQALIEAKALEAARLAQMAEQARAERIATVQSELDKNVAATTSILNSSTIAKPRREINKARALLPALIARSNERIPLMKSMREQVEELPRWRPKKYRLQRTLTELEKLQTADKFSLREARGIAKAPVLEDTQAERKRLDAEREALLTEKAELLAASEQHRTTPTPRKDKQKRRSLD